MATVDRLDLRPRLWPRELHVLQAVAAGMSNDEIAERLYITRSTVKSNVARLLARLGAHNRAHAVAIGYQLGYLQLDRKEPPS